MKIETSQSIGSIDLFYHAPSAALKMENVKLILNQCVPSDGGSDGDPDGSDPGSDFGGSGSDGSTGGKEKNICD